MRFRLPLASALFILTLGLPITASAQLYWDIDGATAGAGGASPVGTWNATNTRWSTSANGDVAAQAWTSGQTAIFSAGTDATGSYAVTVSGGQTVSGITVEEGNPSFSGTSITYNDGSIIDISTGLTTTFGNTMTNAAGNKVNKNGNGTLILNGGSSTGFLGEFVLNSGTVGVGNTNSFGNTASSSTLTVNGGTLASSVANRSLPGNLTVNLNGNFSVGDSLGANEITFNGIATIRNSNRVITVDGSGILTLANTLGQDVAGRTVTKQGTGTLRFETDSTEAVTAFSGDLTVLNGRIEVSGSGRIGNQSNTINFSGGSLRTTASRTPSSAPIANPIHITAPTEITTTATTATVDLNFIGNFTNTGGSLTFRNDAPSGTGVFEPRFTNGDTTFGLPIAIQNGSFGTTRLSSFNPVGTTHTFDGVISGNGSYRRSVSSGAGGTTVFSAANNLFGHYGSQRRYATVK